MSLRPVKLTAALLTAMCALPALSQAQQQFQLGNPNSTWYAAHGVYVGPYYGSTLGQPIDLICDDYWDAAQAGQTWTANVTSLFDMGGLLARTRWGQVYGGTLAFNGVQDLYIKAVWLATQFYNHPQSDWAGIHSTLWDLFADAAAGRNPTGWSEETAHNWLADMPSGFANSGQLKYWYVVTDVNTREGLGGTQEYLTYVTPEPATLILLGTGMLGLVLFTGFVRRTAA